MILQHDFGIFGGPAGSHVLRLLRELHMPVIVTLHTVPDQPTARSAGRHRPDGRRWSTDSS